MNAKKILILVLGLVLVVVILFSLEYLGIKWYGYFEPKRENVRRNVFENTKSYTQGKVQDLAKYYKEWSGADDSGKKVIESVVGSQFSDFDESKINNSELKSFLTKARGY